MMTVIERSKILEAGLLDAIECLDRATVLIGLGPSARARRVLKSVEDVRISQSTIRNAICEHYLHNDQLLEVLDTLHIERTVKGVNDALNHRSRLNPLPLVRYTIYYFLEKKFKYKKVYLGSTMGGRDHSTVIHGLRTYQDRIDTEPELKELHEQFEKQFKL